MTAPRVVLRAFAGTVEVRAEPASALGALAALELPGTVLDERTACLRAQGLFYAELVLTLARLKKDGVVADVVDEARAYDTLALAPQAPPEARDYQREAFLAWQRQRGRGVVVLPTGAGKTEVALLAIADRQRATLVVAPTLDLVRQWHEALTRRFDVNVGVVGGGEHTVLPVTVTTYDSAWAHMEHLSPKFGLIVFDEAHHLVSESYATAARLAIAPYRLGLTATPERPDGKDQLLFGLIGPIVYRKEIDELEGSYLADYDVERIEVALTEDDQRAYDAARATYRAFLKDNHISLAGPRGWDTFIKRAAGSAEGRAAIAAWRLQKRLAFASAEKLEIVRAIFHRHPSERTLVFTDDNATAYEVSRRFLVPVITHQTKVKERSELLRAFADGALPILATSRVLNEGVDVPDAQVAIVISGTGSTREHVQRLGRILRPRPGKRARLYELISAGTAEAFTSDRRRDHRAYERANTGARAAVSSAEDEADGAADGARSAPGPAPSRE